MPEYIGGIALIGDPGSGKTAISEELMRSLGWDRASFATELKNDIAAVLTHDGDSWLDMLGQLFDPATKDKYRPLLQAYGATTRMLNPDRWVDSALRGMSPDGKYVVDDCRYFNEYEALRARGFKFVYLQRGPTTRALPAAEAAHESEQDWHRFKTDIVLTYEPGPKHQAERIIRMLKLRGEIEDKGELCACGCNKSCVDHDAAMNAAAEAAVREIDAATKGLAGAVGPDGVMDETLWAGDHPGPVDRISITFDPPYWGYTNVNFGVVVQEQTDDDAVAVPV